jgi:23S rRNA (uracil1939-C5)-methyltransferase
MPKTPAVSLSPSETVTVTVTDLSRGGPGVARDDQGRVIFLPLTAPGDRVVARIVGQQKRYAQGEVVEWLERSPLRVEPACEAFGRCGGCQWQHLPYDYQWKTKVAGVRHALERSSVAVPAVFEELPAEQVLGYRNRIQLRSEGQALGFFARRSHETIDLKGCPVARSELNAVWEETRALAVEKNGTSRDGRTKVELEVLPEGSIRRIFNAPHAAGGFRQVHDAQNEKLKAWVASAVPDGAWLFDLYGGSGNLSLGLASRQAGVDCVDVGGPIPAAPGNFRFHRKPVRAWLQSERKRLKGALPGEERESCMVLDPPREGLERDFVTLVEAADAWRVETLVLVGCDVDSWVRDLARLGRHGWKVSRVGVLDLFPQTAHVESLAVLKR